MAVVLSQLLAAALQFTDAHGSDHLRRIRGHASGGLTDAVLVQVVETSLGITKLEFEIAFGKPQAVVLTEPTLRLASLFDGGAETLDVLEEIVPRSRAATILGTMELETRTHLG